MDEKETMLKVNEKIKELQAMAKKKKNMLEYQEVLDFLRDTELGKEEIEKICRLHNVTPVREGWSAQATFFAQ